MPDRRAVLGATALLAVCAVGCAAGPAGTPAPPAGAPPPMPAAPDPGPLPPPEALTGVLDRLADPAIPGAEKLGLVADSAPPEAAALDRFAAALRDGGFAPPTFTATEIGWAGAPPTVRATITVGAADTDEARDFTFPMEFRPTPAGWQLTRDTAEMLLAFGEIPAR